MLSALNVPSQGLPLSGQGDVHEKSFSNSHRYIDDSKWICIELNVYKNNTKH